MTFWEVLLITIAVALATLAISALFARRDKRKQSPHYDERQAQIRGRAAVWSMGAGMIYLCVILPLPILIPGMQELGPLLLTVVGFGIQALIFCSYCIYHDAHVPLTQSAVASGLLFLCHGVLWLSNCATRVHAMRLYQTADGQIIRREFHEVLLNTEEGMLPLVMLIGGTITSILGIMTLVFHMLRKRGE